MAREKLEFVLNEKTKKYRWYAYAGNGEIIAYSKRSFLNQALAELDAVELEIALDNQPIEVKRKWFQHRWKVWNTEGTKSWSSSESYWNKKECIANHRQVLLTLAKARI